MACSSQRRICGSGRAPRNSSTTSPSAKSFTLGMLWMPYSAASSWCSSVFTLASTHSPRASPASRSSTGPSVRHGPHHGAQKSTRTGTWRLFSMTSLWKSVTSWLIASPGRGDGPLRARFPDIRRCERRKDTMPLAARRGRGRRRRMAMEQAVRFPGERDLPPGVGLPGPVEQREYLMGGELRRWDGPMQEVLSPVWTEGPGGPVPRGSAAYPLLDEAEALRGARRRGGAPTTTAAAPGRPCRWRSASRCVEDFARRMTARRDEVVRLLMWEIGKTRRRRREGVRPHRRVHPRHDRRAEGPRPRLARASPSRRASSARSAARPLGRRPLHGPVQLPAQRDLHHADPGADHGQHRGLQAAEASACCCTAPLLRGLPRRPSRRAWSTPSTATGRRSSAPLMAIGQGRRAGLHRHQPGGRHRSRSSTRGRTGCAASSASTPRTRPSSCPTPTSTWPCASACSARSPSTASAARRSRSSSSTQRSPSAFLARLCRGGRARCKRGMPWDDGRRDHAAARAGQAGVPARAASTTRWRTAARGRQRGRRRGARHASSARRSSTRSTPACALYHEEQFGPVIPVVPFDDLETPIALRRRVELRPAGEPLRHATRERLARLDRPAGQPGLPRQPQQPVPARAGHASPSPAARTRPRARSRSPTRCASSPSARWWRPRPRTSTRRILADIVRERRSSFLSTDFIF